MIAGLGPVTIDEFLRGHAPLALELNFEEIECGVIFVALLLVYAAADQQARCFDGNFSGRQFSRAFMGILRRASAMHLQRFTFEEREGSRPGLETAQAVEKIGRGASEIHAAVFPLQDRRERGLRMILRLRLKFSFREQFKRFDHEVGADGCELWAEGFRGVFGNDGQLALKEDVAGIEAGVDAHGCNSGDRFTVGDRPLDGGRASILWQQRCVQVQIAEAGKIDHPLRDDASIADDDDGVRRDGRKPIAKLGVVLDGGGLLDG